MRGDRTQGAAAGRPGVQPAIDRHSPPLGRGAALVRWLPAAAWAGAIFFLSSQSRLPEPPGIFGWDKLQHCAAYALGGLLIARGVGVRGRGLWIAAALGSLYGASDELHQWFVPGRNSDVRDWMADTVGVLAGACIQRFFTLRRARDGTRAAGRAVEASAT